MMTKQNKYLTDEDIDQIMRERISTFRNGDPKAIKGTHRKWPEEELELRHSRILQKICKEGMSRAETAKWIRDNWGCTLVPAQKYVREALQELVVDYEDDVKTNREQHLETLYGLLNQAINDGQRALALKILDQIGKVNGVFIEKKEVNLDTTVTFDFE